MSRRTQLTESAGAQSTPTYVQGRQLEMSLASNAEPISSTPGPSVPFVPPPPPPPLPSFVQGNSRDGQSASGADAVSRGSATDTTQTRSRTLPGATGASTALIPEQLKIGMRVRALYKFEPTAEEDLGFEKGDIITIVGREIGSDWWDGQLNGHTGVIPSNFVVCFYFVNFSLIANNLLLLGANTRTYREPVVGRSTANFAWTWFTSTTYLILFLHTIHPWA